jgi:hypothetical protein
MSAPLQSAPDADGRTPLCSVTARERADPLTASAVPTRRWLLIEHPGPWAPDAFGGSGIDPAVRAEIFAASRATGTRPLLVRRPGRLHRTWPRAWAVVDSAPGVPTRWGRWKSDGDLAEAVAHLTSLDASGRAESVLERPSSCPEDLLLLVCTHGRHDTCCAVRGRPVAAALATRWPAQTWECSHVGGDRFAANVVVLPDGAYYGDVEPAAAVDVVAAHVGGAISVRHLRGLSTQLPVVQAAFTEVLTRFGPAGPRDATCTGVTQLAEERWRVELACTGPLPATVAATVTRGRRPAAMLTCRASRPSVAWEWTVTDLVSG